MITHSKAHRVYPYLITHSGTKGLWCFILNIPGVSVQRMVQESCSSPITVISNLGQPLREIIAKRCHRSASQACAQMERLIQRLAAQPGREEASIEGIACSNRVDRVCYRSCWRRDTSGSIPSI